MFVRDSGHVKCCSNACRIAQLRATSEATLVDRFWAKVNKTESCWLWTSSKVKGYGHFHLPCSSDGAKHGIYAHRFAWASVNGPIPDGLAVLHTCDTPACVNPNHLFLGTQTDNLADARAKGRLVDGRHLIKVDDAGMADIRTNYRPRQNGKQLAAHYGISLVHLMRIVKGTARVHRPLMLERVPSVQLQIRGEVA